MPSYHHTFVHVVIVLGITLDNVKLHASDLYCHSTLNKVLTHGSLWLPVKPVHSIPNDYVLLQHDKAIEPIIMLLWQKLPACVTKKELQLQLWWASHQIVSLTNAWFTACGRRVSHPQVRQMHTVILL